MIRTEMCAQIEQVILEGPATAPFVQREESRCTRENLQSGIYLRNDTSMEYAKTLPDLQNRAGRADSQVPTSYIDLLMDVLSSFRT